MVSYYGHSLVRLAVRNRRKTCISYRTRWRLNCLTVYVKNAAVSKILVPVDLRPQSVEVAMYASSLAQRFSAQLLFLHSSRIEWALDHDQIAVRDTILNLTARTDRLLFRRGAPTRVIIETARAEEVDLILMASRAKPFLTRLFDGSTTAQVLRKAPCPVWAALDSLLPLTTRPIRSIVCEAGGDVLDFATRIADRFDARVFIREASRIVELTPVYEGPHRAAALLAEPVDIDEPDLLVTPRSPDPKLFGDLRTTAYHHAARSLRPVACL